MSDETKLSDDKVVSIVKEKKKRGAKWVQELTADGGGMLEPGDNSRFVRHALASWNLPPIDISDEKQVAERIEMYFRYCMENDRRPQVVGLSNWLGVSRETLNTWKNGEYRNDTHSDIIKKAYGFMEEMWTDYMTYGKVNPPTGIFLSKNWFNYKDVADVVVTPNNPMQDLDAETARKRLIDAIPDDDE
jgi:hypothetical protein